HYMEHTRHEFCESAGLSFRDMHLRGIDPVLSRVEIRYRKPLGRGDSMVSCLNISRRGPLFVFEQDIYSADGTPVVEGIVEVACLENGRLSRGEVLAEAFAPYLSKES
ncbi:MAG: acyl-CoA thioesterase, partial [Muribaculaceae bacterium]|nr:acyl-CoA thioesterase [Muribaculaceae bacterium]